MLSTSWLSACQMFGELPQGNFFSFFFSSAMMAGDEKGKGKAVVKSKRKWTHEERKWDHALAVPDTQGQTQRPVRIRETPEEAQGESGSGAAPAETELATVAAQGTLCQNSK
jgi:hypothetical protein